MEKSNKKSSHSPTVERSPQKSKELTPNRDGDQKGIMEQTDDTPYPRKSRTHASPVGVKIIDDTNPRMTRQSLTASIRKAFTPRAVSQVSASRRTKDGTEWNAQQKQRRDAEFSFSHGKGRSKIGIDKLRGLVWHSFFWMGTYDFVDIPEIVFDLRQFAIYIIHLSIILSIYSMISSTDNYSDIIFSDSITQVKFQTVLGDKSTLPIKFNDIRTIRAIWDFMYQVLLPALLGSTGDKNNEMNKVLGSSILIGAPQIRQVRAPKANCEYHPIIQGLYVDCYDYYSVENEDKEPFGMNSSAWMYKSDAERDVHHGVISSYGGGGYAMNITTMNFTRTWLEELEKNQWIRLGTRAVIITLGVTSSNVYIAGKLIFELPPFGGVIPSSYFYTGKFNRFSSPWRHLIMGCELCLLAFTIYYTVYMCKLISKIQFTSYFWVSVDFIILSLSYAVLILEVSHIITVYRGHQQLLNAIHTSESVSFDGIIRHQTAYEYCGKLLASLAVLKLFRYSFLIKSTALIFFGFCQVKFELLEVIMVTVVVTMGFAILGLSIFGYGVIQFRSVWEAFFGLMHLQVSSLYSYRSCTHVSTLGSFLLFPPYIAFIFLYVLTTCVALVVYGFQKASNEMDGRQTHIYLEDVIREAAISILMYCRCYRVADIFNDMRITKRNENDYDAFVRILLKHKWQLLEVRLFMKSHGLYRGENLALTKLAQAYNDFWVRNFLNLEVNGHNKIEDSIAWINNVVEHFEITLNDVKMKAETLADKTLLRKSRI